MDAKELAMQLRKSADSEMMDAVRDIVPRDSDESVTLDRFISRVLEVASAMDGLTTGSPEMDEP